MKEQKTGFTIFKENGGFYTSQMPGRPQTLEKMIEFVRDLGFEVSYWAPELTFNYGGHKPSTVLKRESKEQGRTITWEDGKFTIHGRTEAPVTEVSTAKAPAKPSETKKELAPDPVSVLVNGEVLTSNHPADIKMVMKDGPAVVKTPASKQEHKTISDEKIVRAAPLGFVNNPSFFRV